MLCSGLVLVLVLDLAGFWGRSSGMAMEDGWQAYPGKRATKI